MKTRTDKRIALALFLPSVVIVVYWIVKGLIKLYNWFISLPDYSSAWWSSLGSFCINNLSIIIVVYLIICLQVAGIVEFRFKKNFLKAFLYGILMTPPVMLITWGRKQSIVETDLQNGE